MPLIQGKSKQAFGHNVGAEMKAGKPQNQALAIAYAVKRRNAQKKASGGMIENEDLDPTYEPEHSAKDAVLKEMYFGKKAQEHEDLAEPAEPMSHVDADKVNMGRNMAHGGQVKEAMDRRERALLAFRSLKHAERYPNGGLGPENMQASRPGGPSGVTTRMPLDQISVRKGPPESNVATPDEQAMFAEGGEVSEDDVQNRMAEKTAIKQQMIKDEAQGGYPNDGASKREADRQQQDEDLHSDVMYAKGGMTGMSQSYPDENLPMNEQDRFYNSGGIARSIMKKRMYAEGGPVDDMGLNDQEQDPDQFMAEFMPAQHYDHSTSKDGSDIMAEDPKVKRKAMIGKLLAEMHMKHLGK